MRKAAFWSASIAVAAVGGWLVSALAPVPARGSEPRFPQLSVDHLTEVQRPIADKILKVSSVGLAGPYNPLLRSPVLASRMYDLLDYQR